MFRLGGYFLETEDAIDNEDQRKYGAAITIELREVFIKHEKDVTDYTKEKAGNIQFGFCLGQDMLLMEINIDYQEL